MGAAINYYERHLGDYAKSAGHLSMLEHGAYTLLLDRYYTTEHGIPAEQAHRIARARTKEEREAVDTVLAEFFTLVDGVWIKNRVEEEIQRYIETIPEAERRKENDKERQRRSRKRRSEVFAELEALGVHAPWNAAMSDLYNALRDAKSQPRHGPVTRDNTASQSPVPRLHTPEEEPLARSLGGEDARAQVGEGEISAAGAACRAMREAGLIHTNPSHPHLLAALAEGVTPAELADVVREYPGKSMTYVVAAARGRRSEPVPGIAVVGAKPVRRLNLITAEEAEALERERGEVHAAH